MGKNKDIREGVEAELNFDPLVDASDVTVEVLGGDVALNGVVGSYPEYLEAVTAAQRVNGVRKVHNHLETVLADGNYRDDALLTTAANNALASAVNVPENVEATAKDGNITLTGTVSFGTPVAAAASAVTYLYGVRNVKNEIEVWFSADPVDVTTLVQDALDRNALVPADSDVAVDTAGSLVNLNGSVRTWAEHDAVVDAVWRTPGGSEVRDGLVITG